MFDNKSRTDSGAGFSLPLPQSEPEPLLQLMEELLAELKPPDPGAAAPVPPPEAAPQETPGSSLLSLAGIVEALGEVSHEPETREAQPDSPVDSDGLGEPDFPSEFEIGTSQAPDSEQAATHSLALDAEDEPPASLLPGFAGKPSAIAGMLEQLLDDEVPELVEALHAHDTIPEPTELTELIESMEREVVTRDPDAGSETAAEAPAPQPGVAIQESCIVFGLDGTRYAVPMRNVTEIDTLPRITPVPHTPGFVRGVTNRRGEVVCVLDLRALLGMEPAPPQPRQRILVMRTARETVAAMVVDEVRGTTALAIESLPGPRGPVNDRVAELLAGVSQHQEQILNVLDVEKLFATQEMRQLTSAGESAR